MATRNVARTLGVAPMKHADEVRQKIAIYYRYLMHVRGERAVVYRREITRLTSELEQVESKDTEPKVRS